MRGAKVYMFHSEWKQTPQVSKERDEKSNWDKCWPAGREEGEKGGGVW